MLIVDWGVYCSILSSAFCRKNKAYNFVIILTSYHQIFFVIFVHFVALLKSSSHIVSAGALPIVGLASWASLAGSKAASLVASLVAF